MKGGPGRFPARCFVQFDRPQVSLGGLLVPAHAFEALAQAVVRGRKAGREPDNRLKLFRRLPEPLIEIKNFRQREAVILFGGMLLDQTLQFGPRPVAALEPRKGRRQGETVGRAQRLDAVGALERAGGREPASGLKVRDGQRPQQARVAGLVLRGAVQRGLDRPPVAGSRGRGRFPADIGGDVESADRQLQRLPTRRYRQEKQRRKAARAAQSYSPGAHPYVL